MSAPLAREDLEALGVPGTAADALAGRLNAVLARHPARDPEEQVRLWTDLREALVADPACRWNFELHLGMYRRAYAGRAADAGPGPAWVPDPREVEGTNVDRLRRETGLPSYEALQAWSVEDRDEFWEALLERLGIVFRKPPDRVRDPRSSPERPAWLPGAEMNIAESCLRGDPGRVAILSGTEASPEPARMTLGDLRDLAHRVANGLPGIGVGKGDRVALYLPMTPESVAAFLGIVLAGAAVVGIADSSSAQEFGKRARIGGAKAVLTVDTFVRDGKELRVYEKVVKAGGPRAVVIPRNPGTEPALEREGDLPWRKFLGDSTPFDAVPCAPADATTVLFSSGTTKDPKAIPWTHTTPIKAAADGYLHHDLRPADVVAWPTSFGWMMGPWLTYAGLVNGAGIALYVGSAQGRGFGEFVERAGVTVLGVVPKLVRSWKEGRTMEGLDWSGIRMFSSTAEPSSPEEMLYLMFLAGYRPIVEYCGGTEVGGGYITGTLVQPCAPSAFTTPALGLDIVLLEDGVPSDRGEVFLVPPSIGLSNELLNYDHHEEYFAGNPKGPRGELLRRHGDRAERLGGGFIRHLGRVDDTINVGGVKTSAEEIRAAIAHDLVYDAKPVAVDVDGSGQHRLVVYAVPRDPGLVGSDALRARLREDFRRAIRERLSPLLAHVHDVVLVPELPQAGPGKTRTMADLRRDYLSRVGGDPARKL